MENDPRTFPRSPVSHPSSYSECELHRDGRYTFVVVKANVVEGSWRGSAFLFTPLVHLGHSGPLPVGRKRHDTVMIRDERQGTQSELRICSQKPAVHLEGGDGRGRERRQEECACALPLCLFSEVDGEHKEDHKDHQQHCHPGSPEPIHQAFLDAPVAVFPAVPVSIRGQAAAIRDGAERREKSQSLLRPHGHLMRCEFDCSSEDMDG